MTETPRHPYAGLPDCRFWKNEAGLEYPELFDPVTDVPFHLTREDKVVTAGSCFAQTVAKFLTGSGFNHYIAEKPHPLIPPKVAEAHHYGLFSARYGNVYTCRQLKQLLLRAYGEFEPLTTCWPGPDEGTYVDPFRPQMQPGGYASPEELAADQDQHLAAVRHMVEEMDYFIFTLGMTEAWVDNRDGAVFPLAPGVAGGIYDPSVVEFKNFDEAETAQDLIDALTFIRSKNPDVKFILTVSPVSVNATFEDRHIYASTVWTKSVLRVAAEKARNTLDDCCYFPSYEVIISPHLRGKYYAPDRRVVTPKGVNHVMRLFFKHFAGVDMGAQPKPKKVKKQHKPDAHLRAVSKKLEVLCDEESITNA